MSRHLIDELVVEIASDGASREAADETWLRRMVVDCLLPVLEEVLDGVGEGDTVLVVPELELDLGEIAASGVGKVAPQRLRAALEDALRRALTAARQAQEQPAAGGHSGPLLMRRTDSELAQLERFLATGTMPWHADSARPGLHVALLESLLAHGDAALWAALARALAAPGSARRLAEQFPEHQLLAVLRGMAGGQAFRFESVLALAKQGRAGEKPAAAWVQVLEAALGAAGEAEARTACARLRADLAPSCVPEDGAPAAGGPAAPASGALEQLLAFLDSGVLPGMPDQEGQAPHLTLLDRWLEEGSADARAVLERVLDKRDSARRLAEQFTAQQLRSVLRAAAGAHAAHFDALLEELGPAFAPAALPAPAWLQVLAAACGAGSDAAAQAACAQLRIALAPAAGEAGGAAQADSPADSPPGPSRQLLAFLANGVPPAEMADTGRPAHHVLLERLLEQDAGTARATLVHALADPRSARRLAEGSTQEQLLAILRIVAGADADRAEALLEQAGNGGAGTDPAAWLQVLRACAGNRERAPASPVDAGAPAAPAVRQGATANAAVADVDALRTFLESGVLPQAAETVGTLAHVALLGRLLDQERDAMRAALANMLLRPGAARRFAQQFPEHQLRAVLRRVAGAQAATFEALLDASLAWPPGVGGGTLVAVRAEALAACAAGIDAQAACARIRAAHGAAPGEQAPPTESEALRRFLIDGASAGVVEGEGHGALLERLLAQDAAALWPVLRQALADPQSAARLVERFPEQQLTALLRQAQPAHAAQCEALLAETRAWAGGTRAMAMAWRLVLALCIPRSPGLPDIAPGLARIRAALARSRALYAARSETPAYRRYAGHAPGAGQAAASVPRLLRRAAPVPPATRPAPKPDPAHESAQALPRKPQALLRLLGAYLGGAGLPPGLRADSGETVHQALLGRLLEQGNSGIWLALGRMLADPACARRLREDFPAHQVREVMGRVGPGQAGAVASGALEDTPRDTPGGTPEVPGAAEENSEQAAPAHRTQLQRLQQFLSNGLLPGADAAGSGHSAHEALLDRLAAHADDHLWRVLAVALARDDSAERLLTQFPQRQLLALARASAPGYAPALERLLRRIEAQAARPGAANGRLAQACLRQMLAACVARPAAAALPAPIAAKAALAVGAAPAGAAPARYLRRTGSGSGTAAERWRGSAAESHAVRLLVQLAGMAGRLGERTGAAYEAGHEAGQETWHQGEGGPVHAPGDRAWEPVLTLRERERMARALDRLCRPLDGPRQAATNPPAAGPDEMPALHGAIAARLAGNGIAPAHRALMLEAIDEKCAEAADPAAFLRTVLAVLTAGAPLDLDALPAPEPASALPTPALPRLPAPDAASAPGRMLITALQAGDGPAVRACLRALLPAHAAQLRPALRHYARHASVRHALATSLPEPLFLDLVGLLDTEAAVLLRALLTPSAPLLALAGHGAAWTGWTLRCRLQALATLAGDTAQRRIDPEAFLRAVAPGGKGIEARLSAALPALRAAAGKTSGGLDAPDKPAAAHTMPPATAPGSRSGAGQPAPADPVLADSSELLVIGNAGMVLAAPYLPRLFGALGLLAGGAFIDDAAAARAVHLLQYMVTGQAETPEYQLVLNKILCGLPTSAPVPAGIVITGAEHDFIESMVGAMVLHAKVFGSSSVAAMRQTFLARKAELQLADEAWQLRIQPGPFDVLLDRLPWSYALLKFGWMTRPVHVTWRPA